MVNQYYSIWQVLCTIPIYSETCGLLLSWIQLWPLVLLLLDESVCHLICVLWANLLHTCLSDVWILGWHDGRLAHVEHDISMWVLRSCFCFALWIWSEIYARQDSSTSWLSNFARWVIHIYVLVVIEYFIFTCWLHMTVLSLLRR